MIDYIQRTARKTLSIIINEKGEVTVKAPKRMPESDIYKFVQSKEKWINSKVNEIKMQNKINDDLFNYKCILFCGKKYKIVKNTKVKDIQLAEGVITIKKLSSLKREVRVLEKFLKNKCLEIVGQRLKYFYDF